MIQFSKHLILSYFKIISGSIIEPKIPWFNYNIKKNNEVQPIFLKYSTNLLLRKFLRKSKKNTCYRVFFSLKLQARHDKKDHIAGVSSEFQENF